MAEGELRQKALPGMIMGPSKEVKEHPDFEYFRKLMDPQRNATDDKFESDQPPSEEKESKKHPWKVLKGTKAYGGPWSEERSPSELGIFPTDVLVRDFDRRKDGPYTSYNVYIVNPTAEQKEALIKAGLDHELWIIRQQLKGKRRNSFMRSPEVDEE